MSALQKAGLTPDQELDYLYVRTLNNASATLSVVKPYFDLAFWEGRNESFSDGSNVSTITDSSAAAQNWTQSNAGRYPIWYSKGASGATLPNGFPFMRHTDDYLVRASSITATAMTMIAVVRGWQTQPASYCSVLTSDNHFLASRMGTAVWGLYSGGDVSYGSAFPSTWSILVWRCNTAYSDYDLSANGLMLNATPGGSSFGRSATWLGDDPGAPGRYPSMDVAAFAIAGSALTAAQVAAASAYFRTTYLT